MPLLASNSAQNETNTRLSPHTALRIPNTINSGISEMACTYIASISELLCLIPILLGSSIATVCTPMRDTALRTAVTTITRVPLVFWSLAGGNPLVGPNSFKTLGEGPRLVPPKREFPPTHCTNPGGMEG